MTKKRCKSLFVGILAGSMLFSSVAHATPESIDAQTFFYNSAYYVDGHYKYDDIVAVQYGHDYYTPFRRMATGDLKKTDGVEKSLSYENVWIEDAPQSVQDWVERSLEYELGQVYEAEDGYTYVLVTRGEQSSGGYSVDITKITVDQWGAWIQTKEKDPQPGEFVTAGVTYPYALVRLKDLPTERVYYINGEGNEIPSLPGILYLPPIEQKTDNIVLFEPVRADGLVTIHGVVRSHTDVAMITKLQSNESKWIEMDSGWTYFLKTMDEKNVRHIIITTFGEDGNTEVIETKKVE